MTGQQSFAYCFGEKRTVNRQIFAGKENCPIKNKTKTVESDLNQDKKAKTLLWREKEANICRNMSPIEIR